VTAFVGGNKDGRRTTEPRRVTFGDLASSSLDERCDTTMLCERPGRARGPPTTFGAPGSWTGRGFGLIDCRFDSNLAGDAEFGTSLFDPLVFRPNDEKNPPVDFVGASGIGGGRWRTVDVGETSVEV